MESHNWLLKPEATQGGKIRVCTPSQGRQNPAANHCVQQQGDNQSASMGTSLDLWPQAWLLLGGPSQEARGGSLQRVFVCRGEGDREGKDKKGKEKGKKKNKLRKGVGDKLLEDKLQVVYSVLLKAQVKRGEI